MTNLPFFEDLTAEKPSKATRGTELGRSREGRPVIGYRFGGGPIKISLLAGCHADEPVGPVLLERFVRYLAGAASHSELLSRFEWWIVPDINPDGAERNKAWRARAGDHYDIVSYLRHVVREPPGDDVEFAFPRDEDDHDARPENRAVYDWWRSAPSTFSLHVSLHGMAVGGGPWFLIDPDWIGRCGVVKEFCRDAAGRLGYALHDVQRNGEKGFVRIDRGFCTRPNSNAMAEYFRNLGDTDTASRFRPSSMETIRSFGGDPLTLVSEVPLFVLPGVGETIEPDDPVAKRWREQITGWQERLRDASAFNDVSREIRASDIRPIPIRDQMLLQWTLIQSGVEQIVGEDAIQEAAVLVPVYRAEDGSLRILLVRRTEGGVHGGQIAFPGGKRAPGDQSMAETAKREASEEIGLDPENVEMFEALPPIETLSTGFRIYPYLVRITPSRSWKRDEREIEEIIDVPIADLLLPENHGEEEWSFPEWPGPKQIAYYRIGRYKLWGATYRILQPLVSRLVSEEWNI
ncbi:MAG: NUDIX domain-containing protein [Candidatus Latescibacterota bacterium]|nr:MAG: NUDIX domain-containing protein [Candidatus Latescibacterota bacterium]